MKLHLKKNLRNTVLQSTRTKYLFKKLHWQKVVTKANTASWQLSTAFYISVYSQAQKGGILEIIWGNEKGLWCLERTGEGWRSPDHGEKMIEPKVIEAIYPAAHRCFTNVCKSLMEIEQMRKNTRVYTQTYTPYLPFTIPCGSSALFADCYGWSLTALCGSALSSTPLLCLTLWPLAWGLRVTSFRSSSSSRGQRQLGYKMLQSIGAVSFLIH